MKKRVSVLLGLVLMAMSFAASAFIVQDKDGNYLDCHWVQGYNGSYLRCELLDYMPPLDP